MLTDMKKTYLTPEIRIQPIDSEDFLDESLPVFDNVNPDTPEGESITDPKDILGNSNSIWDQE